MNFTQLRFVQKEGTTTTQPILQYRTVYRSSGFDLTQDTASDWKNVPTVFITDAYDLASAIKD